MTLQKRNSRTILIDNIRYRWLISPNKKFVIVVVQQEKANGQKIEVHVATDIHSYWIEFPYTENLNLKVITPKDTAAIIRQALTLGWQPENPGKPLIFDFIDSKLLLRKT
jgi:hypothetical protein